MKSNTSLPDHNHRYSTIPFLVLSTIGAGRVAWQAGKVGIFCLLCFDTLLFLCVSDAFFVISVCFQCVLYIESVLLRGFNVFC